MTTIFILKQWKNVFLIKVLISTGEILSVLSTASLPDSLVEAEIGDRTASFNCMQNTTTLEKPDLLSFI